jgi:hypothetical protein
MKSPPRARSPTLVRILLYSGFWTKCGAPHFAPLLPNTQIPLIKGIATMEPFIPSEVRDYFPPVEVRASVSAFGGQKPFV